MKKIFVEGFRGFGDREPAVSLHFRRDPATFAFVGKCIAALSHDSFDPAGGFVSDDTSGFETDDRLWVDESGYWVCDGGFWPRLHRALREAGYHVMLLPQFSRKRGLP